MLFGRSFEGKREKEYKDHLDKENEINFSVDKYEFVFAQER